LKVLQGYIPNLRYSGTEQNDKFGFIATASSYLNINFHPVYAFNGLFKPRGSAGRLWRISLRGADGNKQRIHSWKLEGSTDGNFFTDLYEAPNPTFIGSDIRYFEIETLRSLTFLDCFV